MKQWLSAAALLLFSACSVAAVKPPAESPVSIVLEFYKLNFRGGDEYYDSEDTYTTQALRRDFGDSLACEYGDSDAPICSLPRPCLGIPDVFSACLWGTHWIQPDANYYSKHQDELLTWQTTRHAELILQTTRKAVVNITMGAAPEPLLKLRVTLVNDNGEWKINDIMPADWPFPDMQ